MAKKSEKRFGQINVDDEPRNERETTFTSNTAKDRSKELTNHGQPSFHEKVECHLQVFNKGEVRSDSCPKGADCVELPMALIQVQGDLSGTRYSTERLLEKLESLQDNGNFDEHDSIITKVKRNYEERGNADMLLVLEIEQAAPHSLTKATGN